jgi:proton-coupled amino acid transporter
MREPHKFPKVLTGVMIFITGRVSNFSVLQVTKLTPFLVLFGGAGALGYLTFGSKIQAVVLLNFDPQSKLVQAV